MSLVRFRPEAYADLAHLVERNLAKVEVAGSSPVIRLFNYSDVRKYIAFLSFGFPLPTDDIISQPFPFVNTFFKVFLIFLKFFSEAFSGDFQSPALPTELQRLITRKNGDPEGTRTLDL